ncbi:MAG: DNA translocase FtsK 4TM domain-containing protein [Bacteroidaceae bacterium]|nr:DNA translocase FtsK 4TM domain-containing protein [Bacteroidaceae bacterium]
MAKKNVVKEPGAMERALEYIKSPNTTFIAGVVIAALAIFFCFSFLSFFSSGGADQSAIDEATVVAEAVENSTGKGGAIVASYLVNDCFGWSSVLIVPLMVVVALRLMSLRNLPLMKWTIGALFGIIWGSIFFGFIFDDIAFMTPGGVHGENVVNWLTTQIGSVGVVLLLAISLIFFMIYLTRETIVWLRKFFALEFIKRKSTDDSDDASSVESAEENTEEQDEEQDENKDVQKVEPSEDDGDDEENATVVELSIDDSKPVSGDDDEMEIIIPEGDDEDVVEEADDSDKVVDEQGNGNETPVDDDELARQFDKIAQQNNNTATEIQMDVEQAEGDDDMGGDMHRPLNPKDELSYYKPPTVDLLDKYENTAQSIDMNEQNVKKEEIVRVLRDFDIEISSIKATVGPTITLYEITPAPGVRINKIRHLEDDIAMSLAALCIRIIAPIPGKGTIGIEVPNANKQIVPMMSLLNSRKYKETDMALPLALGKTISNEVFMVDMAKMPHLLVAGATGMGKSVGLNAIITSLLFKMHPAYLKFVMVDPKMVELNLYRVIEKHFLAKLEDETEPIITDVSKVVRTLKSLCTEMDNRYRLLMAANVRSVKEYNEKFLNKELLPTKGHRFMPYIVVIIDEYGDLMMTAGKEVETPIARIAQKARAVGIHMIIATQRPTTNIITGTIKANFPARMAFRVISQIDSRTILERTGANQLQGRGDMLFLAGNDPVRVQCALIETKEVERVCAHIAKQQGYASAYILPEPDESTGDGGSSSSSSRGDAGSVGKLDELFADAARTVVMHQQGSTSLLQRKFNIGFNRAGRIMDQLCQTGIVGEQDGSKPRQVLCPDEADLEFRLKSLLNNNQ